MTVSSVCLLDEGSKIKNQMKREKKRPPGTVEVIVSQLKKTKQTKRNLWHIWSIAFLTVVKLKVLLSCFRWGPTTPSTASLSNSTSHPTNWFSWTSFFPAASTPDRWERSSPSDSAALVLSVWSLVVHPLLQKLFVPDLSQSDTDLKSPSTSEPTPLNESLEKPSHVSGFHSTAAIYCNRENVLQNLLLPRIQCPFQWIESAGIEISQNEILPLEK